MSTTTTITEDVLLANAEFIDWCDTWQEQGRCPRPMADWMLETYGDERMYRVARWAWT